MIIFKIVVVLNILTELQLCLNISENKISSLKETLENSSLKILKFN